MFKITRIKAYENLHILLWLMKDTCWVMDWKVAGILMIIPAIAVAVHITWLGRGISSELFHNLAVCMWITANSVWMLGEFFYDDKLRPVALIFFSSGLITLGCYYFIVLPRKKIRE